MAATTSTTVADRNAERLAAWEGSTRWLIVLAALLPLVGVLDTQTDGTRLVFDLACWGVFAIDLVVHVRWRRRYLTTRWGVFDLVIVVVTFPWYIVPGLGAAELVMFARLARLVRVVALGAKSSLMTFVQRMGKAAVAAGVLCLLAAIVVKNAEPAGSGFDTYGDGFWWSIVTLTTVGYGDLYPVSPTGRVMAVVLMVSGLAVLGTIAGSLASLFEEQEEDELAAAEAATGASAGTPVSAEEIAALRDELRALRATLDRLDPGPSS